MHRGCQALSATLAVDETSGVSAAETFVVWAAKQAATFDVSMELATPQGRASVAGGARMWCDGGDGFVAETAGDGRNAIKNRDYTYDDCGKEQGGSKAREGQDKSRIRTTAESFRQLRCLENDPTACCAWLSYAMRVSKDPR